MFQRLSVIAVVSLVALALSAPSALAFRCPKLVAAGRRLADKAMGGTRSKAIALLDEAEAAHKGAKGRQGHIDSMRKATDAIDLLTK